MAKTQVTRLCEHCGASFTRDLHRQHQPRFCSPQCFSTKRARHYLVRLAERLAAFTNPDACWEWTGSKDQRGYGLILDTNKRDVTVHRAAWELFRGPIQNGLFVCHRCDNPPCCNPAHLFLGTNAENIRDRDVKGRGVHGTRCWTAKLNHEQVRTIRIATGTYAEIGAQFGVSPTTVWNIRRRKIWKHVV